MPHYMNPNLADPNRPFRVEEAWIWWNLMIPDSEREYWSKTSRNAVVYGKFGNNPGQATLKNLPGGYLAYAVEPTNTGWRPSYYVVVPQELSAEEAAANDLERLIP